MKILISFLASVILVTIVSWTYHTTMAKQVANTLCGTTEIQSFVVMADKGVETTELEEALNKNGLKYETIFKMDDTVQVQSPFWPILLHSGTSVAIGLSAFSFTYKLLNKKIRTIG